MAINYIRLAMAELEKGNYKNYNFYMSMNRKKRVHKKIISYDDFQENQCDDVEDFFYWDSDEKRWHWSEWEREYLERSYLTKSDKEIAVKLDRPINGIKWQRRKMGLKKPYNWKKPE